jgi:uncharacterized protein (DUF433 family)
MTIMTDPMPTHFTVAEAAYVAGLPDKIVHREIDAGIIRVRGKAADRLVGLDDVLYCAIVRDMREEIAPQGRKLLYRSVVHALGGKARAVDFHGFKRPLATVRREIGMRLADVRKVRRNVESRTEIRAGEPIVRGTRIPARMIAGLVARGAGMSELERDYDLKPEQVEACVLFDRLSPKRGRPTLVGRVVAEDVLPD